MKVFLITWGLLCVLVREVKAAASTASDTE